MQDQLISNWDNLYQNGNNPQWEDLEPNQEFLSLVHAFIKPEMKVLEIGSGLGHNALELAKKEVDITASDVSSIAMERCKKMAEESGFKLGTQILDIMSPSSDIGTYDLVFDKGCWHSFFTYESRRKYVTQVCTLLCEGGIWVNSSGSADNPDDPSDPHVGSYPRLTLSDITSLVEPHFEIIQIRRGQYGNNTGKDFYTWEGVFKKRANQAIHATSA